MDLNKWVKDFLLKNRDEKYKKFSSSLLPGIDNIIGVRLPVLRKLAKKIYNSSGTEYLKYNSEYFEEIMLKGFITALIEDEPEVIFHYIRDFISYIDNWSVCDSFCNSLKFIKSNKNAALKFIEPYLKSDKEFEQRFGLVILINYFVEKEYLNIVFALLNNIKSEKYYSQMAFAWLIAECYAKFPADTLKYLKNNNFPDNINKKIIKKINESSKISIVDKKSCHCKSSSQPSPSEKE